MYIHIYIYIYVYTFIRGSYLGGTAVQIVVPAEWVLHTPSLLFGDIIMNLTIISNTTMSRIYTCITPKGVTGLVTLSLYDSQYMNSGVYLLGLYRYENPAEITAISPSSMMIGIICYIYLYIFINIYIYIYTLSRYIDRYMYINIYIYIYNDRYNILYSLYIMSYLTQLVIYILYYWYSYFLFFRIFS
jgi:hypothetical protein